ncbi:MAG: sel1 repeat family protein [Lachnospiraceae bacterium]|nr:sel1 repeat family protein [Lachnospiraceae bacterium]
MNSFFLSDNDIKAIYYSNNNLEDLAIDSYLCTPFEKDGSYDCELLDIGEDYEDAGMYEEAYKYYVESILVENNPYALNNLGRMYSDGIYVERNDPKACHYFEIAHARGVEQRAGDYLMMGSYRQYDVESGIKEGLTRDLPLAIKWYLKMVECGYIDGYSNIGCVFLEKEMLDYDKAYECFEIAGCEDSRSQYYKAFLLEFGLGRRRNIQLAKYYFERIIQECKPNDMFYQYATTRLREIKEKRIPVLKNGYYFGSDPRVD